MLACSLAAVVLIALAAPVDAEPAPPAWVGAWDMSGLSEGDEACKVTLTPDETIGGFALEAAADCAQSYSVAEDFYAWAPIAGGGVGIYSVTRQRLLAFAPAPDGDGYIAQVGPDQDLQLSRPRPPGREPTEAERMSGRWALTALSGEVLCAYELTPGKDGMQGGLKRLEPCAAAWSARGLVRWERSKGRLLLIDGAGKTALTLPGDSIQGFFSPMSSQSDYGFTRQWDDR